MNRRLANVLGAVSVFAAASVANAEDADASTRIMPPPGCGFIPLPQPVGELTARYIHCGGSFILIKVHWSGGNTGTSCIWPWEHHPFFRSDGQVVVNAYYVPTPPNLSGPPGNQWCSQVQPHV